MDERTPRERFDVGSEDVRINYGKVAIISGGELLGHDGSVLAAPTYHQASDGPHFTVEIPRDLPVGTYKFAPTVIDWSGA